MPLDVTARDARGPAGDLEVPTRVVEPVIARGEDGDGLVHFARWRPSAEAEDGTDPSLVGQQSGVQLDVMDAGVDAVYDQVCRVVQAVAGKAFAHNMPGDRRRRHGAV